MGDLRWAVKTVENYVAITKMVPYRSTYRDDIPVKAFKNVRTTNPYYFQPHPQMLNVEEDLLRCIAFHMAQEVKIFEKTIVQQSPDNFIIRFGKPLVKVLNGTIEVPGTPFADLKITLGGNRQFLSILYPFYYTRVNLQLKSNSNL